MSDVDDRAPISPGGWQIWRHTYKSQKTELLWRKPMSLAWCRRYLSNWAINSLGHSELFISPVEGWESIKADPFGAIAWAIAQELVSVGRGAILIRDIAEEVADRLPDEGRLGLALFYLRAIDGGDDEIDKAVEQLDKNLRGRVGDVDAPIPF